MRRMAACLITAAVLLIGIGGAADAVTVRIGNDAIDRTRYDTYRNFTIVDTNNPAPFDGTFQQIEFFAERAGSVHFVIVDAAGEVTWISDVVAAAAGLQTVSFPERVGVVEGSNLGVYSVDLGVVSWSYDDDAEPAPFTANNTGKPDVGDALTYQSDSERFYSMNASVDASSPEVCKKGGWETWGYKNQGQCIASVVANERAGK